MRLQPHEKNKGMTIIQVMLILLIAGILGSFAVNYMIDKRCEDNPTKEVCVKRQAGK